MADALFDRAVLNDANLRNANFERTVLTRSDLTGAKIDGTDFSNALVDKTQQIVRLPLCCEHAHFQTAKLSRSTHLCLRH